MIVKIFGKPGGVSRFSKTALHLEQEINAWLEANPEIRIIDIKQSCCGGNVSQPITLISIWYEPKA